MTTREIDEILKNAGIENATHEAYLIMEHFSKKSRAYLLADRDFSFENEEMISAVAKRGERYPLQYILGTWEFCGLTFKVNSDCLIPRPDTEVIVEEAVKHLKKGSSALDLCTGSGCILAATLKLSGNTRGVAVELYSETAALARENFDALGLSDVTVIEGDATTDLFDKDVKFDVITANPPYITTDEMQSLEPELSFEPAHALTDGGNGLSILRKIIEIYRHHLAPGGVMILEHGYKQGEDIKNIAEGFGMTYTPILDYGGNTRGAVLENK